jgi:hypothetical protein
MTRLPKIITLLATLAMCFPARSTQGSLTFVDDYAADDTKGRFVMEAESYADRNSTPNNGWWEVDGASHEFIEGPSAGQVAPTATGGARENYMEVLGPSIGEIPPIDASYAGPFMDYRILVETTGSYRLYVRWRGRTGSTDSLYAYILKPDGTLLTDAGPNYFLFHQYRSGWIWDHRGVKNTVDCAGAGFPHDAVWTIAEPGVYTIRIAQRETESALDALLFQTSNLSDPSGQGPPQSQLRGGLQALEITGPDEVPENSSANYNAIAHYDNNSTRNVTDLAVWSVEPNTLAAIDENGLLTTQPINYLTEDVTIYAQYTEDGNTFDAEKPVSILAICPTGSALDFDGENDYVEVIDDPSLRFSQYYSFSICLWTKPLGTGYLLSKMRTSQQHGVFGYEMTWTASKFSFLLESSFVQNINLFTPDNSAPAGSWYFVTAVYNNKDMKIYLNGTLANHGTFNRDTGSTTPDKNLAIGARSYDSTIEGHFNGTIDEVVIYDRALSAEEIQMLMHARPDADEPNLVAYWNFDEGEGQVAYDLSSNANHGRLGSDPNADDSDPAWVDSDAPVGICTPQALIERNLYAVLQIKYNFLEQIAEAFLKEDATSYLLEEMLATGDYGDLNRRSLRAAKNLLDFATQRQHRSQRELLRSVETLEDVLLQLGIEPHPNNPLTGSSAPKRQLRILDKPALIAKPPKK